MRGDSLDEKPNSNEPADSSHIGETERERLVKKNLMILVTLILHCTGPNYPIDVDSNEADGISSLYLPDTVAQIANNMFQWKLESSKTVDRQYRKGSGVVL